jgi:hypothetical protein
MSRKTMSRSRIAAMARRVPHKGKGIGVDESSTYRLGSVAATHPVRLPLWPKDSLYIDAGALAVAASNQSGIILFKEAIFELPVVYKSEFECVEALMRGTGS